MRGHNAGDTADHDSTAIPTTPRTAPRATLIRTCDKCGSHFSADFEEHLCANCVAWAELYQRVHHVAG